MNDEAGGAVREDRRRARLIAGLARLRSDAVIACLDVLTVALAYTSVLVTRFEGSVPPQYWSGFRTFLPVAAVVFLASNWMWGLYGQMWRHASVQEARRVVLSGATVGVVLGLVYLPGQRPAPGSVVILGTLLAMMLTGALRFHSRLFSFHRRAATDDRPLRVVVIGAGESGAAMVREMLRQPGRGPVPVALVDDDPRKQGKRLSGIPVVGGIEALPETVERFAAEQALLAIPSASSEVVRRVASTADELGLTLKVLPSVAELVGGQVSMRDVRDLSIDDLLGRQQVEIDLDAVRSLLAGRRVLVTGAGGSIGSELARQIAACEPSALLLLDHDETHLYDAASTLAVEPEQILADIRDADVVDAVFDHHRPEVVFHAAAHKHVPLLEAHACEAVRTNVLGTRAVVEAADRYGVDRFVFISTDKAVRPCNVMGASKRVAEQVVLGLSDGPTRYCAVRFGNVLGSRGSVVPTFTRQIAEGGPVTVTDPLMTRYFMSIPEAVRLVLQAAVLSDGGEVFMLDMGSPVRILDLAERMIRLSGRTVGTDVAVHITGVRPGEKLHEELSEPDEVARPTSHPSVIALQPKLPPRALLERALDELERAATSRADAMTADILHRVAAVRAVPAEITLPDVAVVLPDTLDTRERQAVWTRSRS